MPTDHPFLADQTDALVPTPGTGVWDAASYAAALAATEAALSTLFGEIDAADAAAEYALSLADAGLEAEAAATRSLRSETEALTAQTGRIAAQALPVTGGSYTHLITESFRSGTLRDASDAFARRPLTLSARPQTAGCPPRPALTVDPARQQLRLAREGDATIFSGLPGHTRAGSAGGAVHVDRIFGTPVAAPGPTDDTGAWSLAVASREPLARGFALGDAPRPSWLPASYASGGVSRLRIALDNPAPATEVRLRGALLPTGQSTSLLETVAAVDSRPDRLDPTSRPTRALSGSGTFDGGALGAWSLISGSVVGYGTAPGRTGTSDTATAPALRGLIAQTIPVADAAGGGHLVLRYRAACPWGAPGFPAAPVPAPVPSGATYVRVSYYASPSPALGTDTPLATELFRDPYPEQGGLFDGWGAYTHLLSPPKGAQSLFLLVGVDPFCTAGPVAPQNDAALALSDVAVLDEAVTRVWDAPLPQPAATQLGGPSLPGGTSPLVDEESVPSLSVSLGNETGALVLTDVWVCLGQEGPSLEPATAWAVDAPPATAPRTAPAPLALSFPADTPSGRAARDPLLLHQVRYAGRGAGETDVSAARFDGDPLPARRGRLFRLRSRNGLAASLDSRSGRRSAPAPPETPSQGAYWAEDPGQDFSGGDPWLPEALAPWPALRTALSAAARAGRRPLALAHNLLRAALRAPAAEATAPGSVYVYHLGLSSLALVRHEYTGSGLYVTQPLSRANGAGAPAVPGEIHEVSVLTDPPLPTLGSRLRLWVIPDGQSSEGDVLSRAVPLDSTTPRATFHSSVESLTGLPVAVSDVAASWGIPAPAFFVTPSFYTQTFAGGLDPDAAATGVRLDHLPYINGEAVRRVSQALAGPGTSPTDFDANAVRPLVDYLPGQTPPLTLDTSGFLSDGTPWFAPGQAITLPIPFVNASGVAVDIVPTYTISVALTQPAGAMGVASTTVTSGAATLHVTAPGVQGRYLAACTLTMNGSGFEADVPFAVQVPNATPSGLYYVEGYRPVACRIALPGGRVIPPDALGRPRPGEVVEQPYEILAPATASSTTTLPGAPAPYAFGSASDGLAVTQVQTVPVRSFVTAHTPLAQGANGTALQLFWHQGVEFDPASGGALSRFDVPIPAADFAVDALTGQVTVTGAPPYNWAAYDQVVATYFWRVGAVAPRETFPVPALDSLYAPLGGGQPLHADPIVVGYNTSPSGELLSDNAFHTNVSQYPETDGALHAWEYGCDNTGKKIGTPDNYNDKTPNNPYGGNPLIADDYELYVQDVPYPGPGDYSPHLGVALWQAGGGDNAGVARSLSVALKVYTTDAHAPVEAASPLLIAPLPWSGSGASARAYTLWPDAYGSPTPSSVTLATPADATGRTRLRIEIAPGPGCVHFTGVQVGYASLTALFTTPVYGYPPGYDAHGTLIAASGSAADVSAGVGAGALTPAPSSVADLLHGPVQQGYPVTRNMTNYAAAAPAPLTAPDMDPASPNYYPVYEYRIDPGGVVAFAADLSTFGPLAGADVTFEYEFLDVDPRLVVEVLPEGQTPFTPPSVSENSPLRPTVTTPALDALHFLINAKT